MGRLNDYQCPNHETTFGWRSNGLGNAPPTCLKFENRNGLSMPNSTRKRSLQTLSASRWRFLFDPAMFFRCTTKGGAEKRCGCAVIWNLGLFNTTYRNVINLNPKTENNGGNIMSTILETFSGMCAGGYYNKWLAMGYYSNHWIEKLPGIQRFGAVMLYPCFLLLMSFVQCHLLHLFHRTCATGINAQPWIWILIFLLLVMVRCSAR